MRYHKITPVDIANGPGCRETLWVAGCEHHCPNCHNPETWDKNGGVPFTDVVLQCLLDQLAPFYIRGLTISGGDPLAPYNRNVVEWIVTHVTKAFPQKDIWIYTGYTWEEIKDLPFLNMVDVIVDGEFIEAEKDIRLVFKGSKNQRVIDVKKSLAAG